MWQIIHFWFHFADIDENAATDSHIAPSTTANYTFENITSTPSYESRSTEKINDTESYGINYSTIAGMIIGAGCLIMILASTMAMIYEFFKKRRYNRFRFCESVSIHKNGEGFVHMHPGASDDSGENVIPKQRHDDAHAFDDNNRSTQVIREQRYDETHAFDDNYDSVHVINEQKHVDTHAFEDNNTSVQVINEQMHDDAHAFDDNRNIIHSSSNICAIKNRAFDDNNGECVPVSPRMYMYGRSCHIDSFNVPERVFRQNYAYLHITNISRPIRFSVRDPHHFTSVMNIPRLEFRREMNSSQVHIESGTDDMIELEEMDIAEGGDDKNVKVHAIINEDDTASSETKTVDINMEEQEYMGESDHFASDIRNNSRETKVNVTYEPEEMVIATSAREGVYDDVCTPSREPFIRNRPLVTSTPKTAALYDFLSDPSMSVDIHDNSDDTTGESTQLTHLYDTESHDKFEYNMFESITSENSEENYVMETEEVPGDLSQDITPPLRDYSHISHDRSRLHTSRSGEEEMKDVPSNTEE